MKLLMIDALNIIHVELLIIAEEKNIVFQFKT